MDGVRTMIAITVIGDKPSPAFSADTIRLSQFADRLQFAGDSASLAGDLALHQALASSARSAAITVS